MQCPSCRAMIADDVLQCTGCGANVAVMVTAPDGQQFGPYSVQSARQYLAEGRIAANAHASVGGGPPMPVQQVVASAGGAPPMPAAPAKKGTSCWLIGGIIAGAFVLVAVVVVVLVFVLGAATMPAFSRAREKARSTSCQSNLKQVSLAILMYCQDWDEVYPTAGDWSDKLMPYCRNEQLFICPDSGLGDQSYEFNSVLDGRRLSSILRPNDSAMVWDAGFPHGTGPHDGGWNVGFCDGHVKLVDPAAAAGYQTTF